VKMTIIPKPGKPDAAKDAVKLKPEQEMK